MLKLTSRSCSNCPAFKFSAFSSLAPKAIEELSKKKVKNIYKKGQTSFIEGNSPYGVFCIRSGNVKVTKTSESGKTVILSIAKAGDFLGDNSLFSDVPYKVTATALEDTKICFIETKTVLKLISTEPTFAMKLIERKANQMSLSENSLASLHQKNVRERLAELLIQLKEEHSVKEPDGRFRIDLNLKRDEMATLIGTASETLIRFIKEFKEAKIIEQVGKTLYINNMSELLRWSNPQ